MSDGLVCEGLTKEYTGSKGKKALVDLDPRIPSEGIFSLIGINGAGKTTLVRILATQLEPTDGRASIDGLDVMKDAKKMRERIACVPQEARTVSWMTPKQTISSYLLWRGVDYAEAGSRASEALAKVGLQEKENVLNRPLSGGMRSKVLVATALSSDADVIFLDELGPESFPDPDDSLSGGGGGSSEYDRGSPPRQDDWAGKTGRPYGEKSDKRGFA